MTLRQERISEVIKQLTAKFLQEESSGQSLITVTNCDISPDLKNATIFITVLPVESEEFALNFAKRKRKELKNYIKRNTKMKIIPFVDVQIDFGEKNRQRIDELISNE